MLSGIKLLGEGLSVNYGSIKALDIEKLDISGNVIGLVGHNGSGKSTFLKRLLGLVSSSSGSLTASQNQTVLVPEVHMAFSPETGAIFADISVEDYLKLWCRLKCGDPHFYKLAGKTILDSLEIFPLLPKLGRELSKGQKRRVQIAVCLLIKPRLLVFDEPFDGLDIRQAASLANTISSYLSTTSLLISSHRMDIVERFADAVIMLDHGRVIASGPPNSISNQLGSKSFSISHSSIDFSSNLREHFSQIYPDALIYNLDAKLIITGLDVSREKIELVMSSLNLPLSGIESRKASLGDTVHAQLKSAKN